MAQKKRPCLFPDTGGHRKKRSKQDSDKVRRSDYFQRGWNALYERTVTGDALGSATSEVSPRKASRDFMKRASGLFLRQFMPSGWKTDSKGLRVSTGQGEYTWKGGWTSLLDWWREKKTNGKRLDISPVLENYFLHQRMQRLAHYAYLNLARWNAPAERLCFCTQKGSCLHGEGVADSLPLSLHGEYNGETAILWSCSFVLTPMQVQDMFFVRFKGLHLSVPLTVRCNIALQLVTQLLLQNTPICREVIELICEYNAMFLVETSHCFQDIAPCC